MRRKPKSALWAGARSGGSGSSGPDVTAPVVITFSPVDNATSVALDATLTATMSETVVLGATGIITLKKTSDDSTIDFWDVALDEGSGVGQVEVLTSTALTMHLSASLTDSIEYYVIWDAGVVEDLSANPIAAQASTTYWSFTAADTTAPILSNALGVKKTDTTASVQVDTDTPEGDAFWYVSSSITAPSEVDHLAGTGAVLAGSLPVTTIDTYSADPISPLVAGTGYYVHWRHRDAAMNVSAPETSPLWTQYASGNPKLDFSAAENSQYLTILAA